MTDNRRFNSYDPRDYDTESYEGMFILPREKSTPVIILRSRTSEPPHWCVVDGYKNSVFNCYKDVMEHCALNGWIA